MNDKERYDKYGLQNLHKTRERKRRFVALALREIAERDLEPNQAPKEETK